MCIYFIMPQWYLSLNFSQTKGWDASLLSIKTAYTRGPQHGAILKSEILIRV